MQAMHWYLLKSWTGKVVEDPPFTMRSLCIYAAVGSLGVVLGDSVRQEELLQAAAIMCKIFTAAHILRRIRNAVLTNCMQVLPNAAYQNFETLYVSVDSTS